MKNMYVPRNMRVFSINGVYRIRIDLIPMNSICRAQNKVFGYFMCITSNDNLFHNTYLTTI